MSFLFPSWSVKLGLPSDFHAPDFKAAEEPPCIIAVLCDLHDGLLVEAKGIKEHYFKPYISKLFDKKVLTNKMLRGQQHPERKESFQHFRTHVT